MQRFKAPLSECDTHKAGRLASWGLNNNITVRVDNGFVYATTTEDNMRRLQAEFDWVGESKLCPLELFETMTMVLEPAPEVNELLHEEKQ